MRILQLSSARHFGGGERHLVDLTRALAQKGHYLFVALRPESPLIPQLSQVPAHRILELPFRNSLDISTAWKLRKFARDHQIEIIHAHVARDYPLAAIAAGRSSVPKLVLTRHVMFPMSPVHRLTRRRVSRVIAVSEAVAENLRAEGTFSVRQIVVVNHGIDLRRFASRNQDQQRGTEGRLRVGMMGELSPVKGQRDFVRAAAKVSAQRDDVEFVINGQDNSRDGENRREIASLIDEAGLKDRMQLIDSFTDVPAFLSTLDVFVSASHSEAFGLAIVEAMACGVPVVATMTGGAREIIVADETGWLVPFSDAGAMAERISALLSDASQRERFAINGRRAVKERFTLDRMVDQTEQVYREVLSEPSR